MLAEHFLLIPIMIDLGWIGADRRRHLTFLFYESIAFNKTFKLVIKSTWERHELIVATFHKIDAEHVRRLKKRCAFVRAGNL